MDAKMENLPVLDWELGARLAGNHIDLAKDMITMLAKSLPDDLSTMNELAHQQDYAELCRRVHKLHGAVAYCGAPRLKNILAHIEMQLKKNVTDNITNLMQRLNNEASALLQACE